MKLYYGSSTNFREPTFGLGKPYNDYGLGFYMMPSYDMAKLWASKNLDGGYLITFDFDFEDLRVLNLASSGEENVLRWIALLCQHRFDNQLKEKYKERIEWLKNRFPVNVDSYDAIVGYRADDSYFRYSLDFVANEMSIESLSEAMKIGKLGIQYVAISKEAFKRIRFLKSERIEHEDAYERFQKKTLNEFHKLRNGESINNTFIRDLMRKYGE